MIKNYVALNFVSEQKAESLFQNKRWEQTNPTSHPTFLNYVG